MKLNKKMFRIHINTCAIFSRCELHPQPIPTNGLRQYPSRSRSVPEGLAHPIPCCDCQWNCRNRWQSSSFRHLAKPIQVVEQITTSV